MESLIKISLLVFATAVALANAVCVWFKSRHQLTWCRQTSAGEFEAYVGIEPPVSRRLYASLNCHPAKRFKLKLDMWSVYAGAGWQRRVE